MRRSLLLLLAFLLLAPAGAWAHDYWLRPDGVGNLAAPGSVIVRMWVGDHFRKGEEKGLKQRKTGSFVHVTSAGTEDLLPGAVDGATPVLTLQASSKGGHLVGMTRKNSRVTLPGWKFTTYLKSERFTDAQAQRKEAGTTWEDGRERYSRYLKTLVQVGGVRDSVHGLVLGHRLEIVPLNDPAWLEAGDPLVLRVLFEEEPRPDARVVARSLGGEEVEGRTDANGVVRLVVEAQDTWLVRTVLMRQCSGCELSDWESFWSSYQFSNVRP